MNAKRLDETLRAVCPIYGVSSAGRIDYRPEATAEQMAAAMAIVDAWAPEDDLEPAADRRAARYKAEADPLLFAALGYQIESEAKPGDATITAKRDKARTDYLAAKAKIRDEIKD